jgi:Hsp20/alpha crystallin family
MRNIDFSPLSRSSIGFERWLERLDEAARAPEGDAGYPPHNIKKIGEEGYRLELALAGFSPEELSIRVERDVLIIAGRSPFTLTGNSSTRASPPDHSNDASVWPISSRSRAQSSPMEFCRSISCDGRPWQRRRVGSQSPQLPLSRRDPSGARYESTEIHQDV